MKVYILIFFTLITNVCFGQYAVNDYGSLGTGNWGTTNANWRQWNGSAWVAAAGAPTTADNVWILAGHTVTVEVSPKNCKNLNIEPGGKLYTNSTGANRFVNVFGNIVCDGTIGNGAVFDCIGFNIEGVTCLINGIGVFDASRIRKAAATNPITSLTISMNVNLRFGTASSTQIYNNIGGSTFNVNVTIGKTLNLTGGAFLGNACIDGLAGTGGTSNGTFTVDGTMIISGILYLHTNNGAGLPCVWNISSTGLIRANEVRMAASGVGTHTLNISSGGKLEVTGTPSIFNFSTTNNIYNLAAGSTVEYSAPGAQTVRSGLNYSDVIFSGSGTKTTDGNLNVGRDLTITGTAALSPGAFSINIGRNWTNYGTAGFTEGTSTVNWNGSTAQTNTTTGGEDFYNLSMNNSSTGLTFNNPASVSNILTLTNGRIYTTAVNLLTLLTNASVVGTSNASFVSGPVRYTGSNAMNFPVGKGTDWQPLGISAGAGGGGTFWTETFTNGCASNCLATGYVGGPNGPWTISSTGTNDPEGSVWYVSCAENGNAAGACGTGCAGADASLHVSSNPTWAGDLGAAYEIGGWCGIIICVSANLRAESPTINCTGKTGITLAFNYIEYGDGTNDDATLWYYDGSTWSLLVNLAKTPCCGGACNTGSFQGQWTAYSVVLPASANNNPNVKIGFNWTNNDDGVGWDPSFAVDDITLSTALGPVSDFTCEYFYSNPQIPYGNILAGGLNSISNCEYWILNRNAGTENKTVTLNWDANSCLIGTVAEQRVARWDGISTWQNEGNSATTGTIPSGSVSSNLVTSFSPFTIGSVAVIVLPVELLEFNALVSDNSVVHLKWITASEINNDKFELERSQDGEKFEYFGTLKGAGNTNSIEHYSYLDLLPYSGTSYYRLKQIDYNGNFTYSQIRPVTITNSQNVQLYPNPTNGNEIYLNIENNSANAPSIYVTDITGKLIVSEISSLKNQGSNYRIYFPEKLTSGTYLVNIKTAEKSISCRFIVY